MSANTSKPSKVQPRFEATSAFHCVRSSDRYQGDGATVTNSVIISSLMAVAAARDEKFTLLSGALGRVRRGHCSAGRALALPVDRVPALSWHNGFRERVHARRKTTPIHHTHRRRRRVANRSKEFQMAMSVNAGARLDRLP